MSRNVLAEALHVAIDSAPAAHPAVVFHDRNFREVTSYGALRTMVEQAEQRLRAGGIGADDLVPLLAERTARAIAMAVATTSIGGAFTWLNTKARPSQLVAALAGAQAPAVFVDEKNATTIEQATDQERAVLRPVSLDEVPQAPAQRSSGERPAAGAACVLFTSGSTGEPKGVMISPENLIARARTEIACYGLGAGDRLLCLLPFSFDVGLNQMLTGLLCGATLHICNAWLRGNIVSVVAQEQITGISAAPSIWNSGLSGLPEGEGLLGPTPSLRYVTISGGSLPVPTFERLVAHLDPHVAIHKTYGQSETFRSSIFARANAPEHRPRWSSVGRAVPGTRILIARDRDTLAAPGERGEVVHAGEGVMMGYLADEALTATKLGRHAATGEETVVYTGDLGHLDAEGYLFLVGRVDTMAKIGGFRVYPKEVEEVLARFPGVDEAVVFAIEDNFMGARLVAVVLGSPTLDLGAARDYMAAVLPAYMAPRQIARWDALPRTASGKPAVPEIRQRYLSEAATT